MPRIQHKTAAVSLCLIGVIMLFLFTLTPILSDDNARFHSVPVHTNINRWRNEYGKTMELNGLSVTQKMRLRYTLPTAPPAETMLIFQTKNMGIMLYTTGKIFYQAAPEIGSRYHMIALEGLHSGDTLYLRLSPAKRDTGVILTTPAFSTPNDFLFALYRRHAYIILPAAVLLLLMLKSLRKIWRGGNAYYRYAYPATFFFLLLLMLLTQSPLLQCYVGSATLRTLLAACAYMLLPAVLFAFLSVWQKQKSSAFGLLSLLTTGYTLLRLCLYTCFRVSPVKMLLPAHFLLIISLLFYLIYRLPCLLSHRQRRLFAKTFAAYACGKEQENAASAK